MAERKMTTAGQRKRAAYQAVADEFGGDIARIVGDALPEGATLRQWRDAAVDWLGLSGGISRSKTRAPDLSAKTRGAPAAPVRRKVPAAPRSDFTVERRAAPRASRSAAEVTGGPGRDIAYGTYELVPYAYSNFRPDINEANLAGREAFTSAPETSWVNDAGTDVIYDVMGLPQLPTSRMTGMYTPPVVDAPTENQPGRAARVLLDTEGGRLAPGEAETMTAGEGVRAYGDVQGGGAWNIPLFNAPFEEQGAMYILQNAPADVKRMLELMRLGEGYNLPNVIDTGTGLIRTSFDDTKPLLSGSELLQRMRTPGGLAGGNPLVDVKRVLGPQAKGQQTGLQTGYAGFEGAMRQPFGSGALTRQLGEYVAAAPTARREALLEDPRIAEAFGQRFLRDEKARAAGVAVGDDIQRSREIIASEGRLRAIFEALRRGLPVMAEGGLVAENTP